MAAAQMELAQLIYYSGLSLFDCFCFPSSIEEALLFLSCVLVIVLPGMTGLMPSLIKGPSGQCIWTGFAFLLAAFQLQLLSLSPSAPTFFLSDRDSICSVLESFSGLINRSKPDSMGDSHDQVLSHDRSD